MRTILIAAVALAFSASAALADDVMASRYGNTTITTDAAGVVTKIYYNADGTFTGKQGTANYNGTWKVTNSTVCLTAAQAMQGQPNPICVPVVAHKVGDTWGGAGRTVALVKGIQ